MAPVIGDNATSSSPVSPLQIPPCAIPPSPRQDYRQRYINPRVQSRLSLPTCHLLAAPSYAVLCGFWPVISMYLQKIRLC